MPLLVDAEKPYAILGIVRPTLKWFLMTCLKLSLISPLSAVRLETFLHRSSQPCIVPLYFWRNAGVQVALCPLILPSTTITSWLPPIHLWPKYFRSGKSTATTCLPLKMSLVVPTALTPFPKNRYNENKALKT